MSDMTWFRLGWQSTILSLLRFVAGLAFLEHGAAKLWGFPVVASYAHGLPPLLRAAGIVEFFGGALVCIGLLTRPAAFLASGEMAIGYLIGACAEVVFPDSQRRRCRAPVLLHLPLPRGCGGRGVEPRSADRRTAFLARRASAGAETA